MLFILKREKGEIYLMTTFYSNKKGGWRVEADVTFTQNTAGNYSDVTVKTYLNSDPTWDIRASGNMTGNVNIDGQAASYGANPALTGGQRKLLDTTTRRVNHNNDGTKTASISFSYNLAITSGSQGYIGWFSGSGSIALTRIPRAMTMNRHPAEVAMDTDNLTVMVNDNGAGYQGWLYMSFGTVKKRVAGPTPIGSNFFVKFKASDFASQIPNSMLGNGTLTLETWQGNTTKIGEYQLPLNLRIPDSYKPTGVSVTMTDTSSVANKIPNIILQGQSKLKLVTAATAQYSSSISSIRHELGSTTIGSGADVEANLVSFPSISGSNLVLKTTVTDSRGLSTAVEKQITITPYFPPSLSEVSARRNTGTPTTVDIRKKLSVAEVKVGGVNKNDYTVKTDLSLAGENYTNKKTETNTNAEDISITSVAIDKAAKVKITVADKFITRTYEMDVASAKALLDLYKDMGVGIGKMYQEGHGVLDIEGDVYLEGLLNLKGFNVRTIAKNTDFNSNIPVGFYHITPDVFPTMPNRPTSGNAHMTLLQLPTQQILRRYEPDSNPRLSNTVNLYRGHLPDRSQFGPWMKESGGRVSVYQLTVDKFRMNFSRSGNMITVSLDDPVITFNSGDIAERRKVGSIPEGLIPVSESYMTITRHVAASSVQNPSILTFRPNGDVLHTCFSGGTSRCVGTVTYMTNDQMGILTI